MRTYVIFSALSVGILVCHFNEGIQVWEGGPIVLPCDKTNDATDVEWWYKREKPEQGTQVAIRLQHGDQVVNPPWSDDVVHILANSSLHITVTAYPRDDGIFECEDSENYVDVQIGRPVTAVSISNHPSLPVMSGTSVTFTCHVDGGHPAPNITWYLGDSKTPMRRELSKSDGISEYTETQTRVSEYDLTVIREMDGQWLVCEASVREKSRWDHIILTLQETGDQFEEKKKGQPGATGITGWTFALYGLVIAGCLVVVVVAVIVGLTLYRRWTPHSLHQNEVNDNIIQTEPRPNPPNQDSSCHYATVCFGSKSVRMAIPRRSGLNDASPYADIDFNATANVARVMNRRRY